MKCSECPNEVPEGKLKYPSRLTCSDKCAKARNRRRYIEINGELGLPTMTIGTIAELIVVADLLRMGYEVFRAASGSCSCDLVILRNGEMQRIEVRSGYITVNGELRTTNPVIRADVLAIVSHFDGRIEYRGTTEVPEPLGQPGTAKLDAQ